MYRDVLTQGLKGQYPERGHFLMTEKKKILIIDDEAVFRKILKENLSYCGYVCKTAESPSEGMRYLKTDTFDLILLDIMMEPLDGWDTLDLIKSLTYGYETPVIMVSSKKMDLVEVIRYGERLYGYMAKPLTREEICAGVYSFFRWYESLHEAAEKISTDSVPPEDIALWLDLSRQVRVITDLRAEAAIICLPDLNRTEEECRDQLNAQVDQMIREKRSKLEELEQKYPVLHTIPQ